MPPSRNWVYQHHIIESLCEWFSSRRDLWIIIKTVKKDRRTGIWSQSWWFSAAEPIFDLLPDSAEPLSLFHNINRNVHSERKMKKKQKNRHDAVDRLIDNSSLSRKIVQWMSRFVDEKTGWWWNYQETSIKYHHYYCTWCCINLMCVCLCVCEKKSGGFCEQCYSVWL